MGFGLAWIILPFALIFHVLSHVLIDVNLFWVAVSLGCCTLSIIPLHELLALLMSIHIADIIHSVHLSGGHHESLLVKEGNHAFLRQHQLNDSLSFMLIQFVVFVEACSVRSSTTRGGTLTGVNEVDTDTKARLGRVDLHLSMLAMLLSFRLDLIDSLLEQNLELSLASQLLVVLLACGLEQPALMLHHFTKLLHDAIIPTQLLFLGLDFAGSNVN